MDFFLKKPSSVSRKEDARRFRKTTLKATTKNIIAPQSCKPVLNIFNATTDDEKGFMLTKLQRKIRTSKNDYEGLSCVLSYILTYFPGLKASFIEIIRKNRFEVVEVQYPNHRIFLEDDDNESEYCDYLIGFLGLYLFIPYKNFTNCNFEGFYKGRANAISSQVGLGKDKLGVPCVVERAIGMRKILDRMGSLRAQLLRAIIKKYKTGHGIYSDSVFGYVYWILEWTEMDAYKFVKDTLIVTLSPVLSYPGVKREVDNLKLAVKAVENSDYPPFFKILAKPHQVSLIERNRFPTLAAVAVKFLSLKFISMKNYNVGKDNISPKYINMFLYLHYGKISFPEDDVLDMMPHLPLVVSMASLRDFVHPKPNLKRKCGVKGNGIPSGSKREGTGKKRARDSDSEGDDGTPEDDWLAPFAKEHDWALNFLKSNAPEVVSYEKYREWQIRRLEVESDDEVESDVEDMEC